MARTLYCRWEQCGWSGEIVAGYFPERCPGCSRESRWNVGPPTVFEADGPKVAWVLTENDRRMLKALRIAANNDHEQDGA